MGAEETLCCLVHATRFSRHLREAGTGHPHTPFLLWILDSVQPRLIVTLGLADQVLWPTFRAGTLAQDEPAFRVGVPLNDEDRPHDHGEPDPHETFLRADLAAPHERFASETIDILAISPAAADRLEDLADTWMPRLSRRGILILRDLVTLRSGAGQQYVNDLLETYPSVVLHLQRGVAVVLTGPEADLELSRIAHDTKTPGRLRAAFSETPGQPAIVSSGQIEPEVLVGAITQVELSAARLAILRAELFDARTELDRARARIQDIEARAATGDAVPADSASRDVSDT